MRRADHVCITSQIDPRTSESNMNNAPIQADEIFLTQHSIVDTNETIHTPIKARSQASTPENPPVLSETDLPMTPPLANPN